MKNQDYHSSIQVQASAQNTFEALTTGIQYWWTKPDQPLTKVGDIAKFSFAPNQSYWTFEATVLEPNTLVELQCVDALHLHEGQPKEIEQEWLGTKLVFVIKESDGQTLIDFKHLGLKPKLLCFEVCEAGWDRFFLDSLKCYLNTGQGKPHHA